MVDVRRSSARLILLLSLFLVFPSSYVSAHSRYRHSVKRHFLSWESLRRPEQFRNLEKLELRSNRRIALSRRRIVRVAKSPFWHARPYQFSTPLLSDDKLYIGVDSGYFFGIDIRMSSKMWTFRTDGSVQSKAAISGKTVFFGDCKANMYAVSSDSGKLIWKEKLDTAIMSTPFIDGNVLYVSTMSGRLYALRISDGSELWHTYPEERNFGFSVRKQSSPIGGSGLIFIGTSAGLLEAFHQNDGTVAWLKTIGNRNDSLFDVDDRPLFINGKLYVTSADGILVCLDAKTGRILWDASAGGVNDPIYYEGKLYVTGGKKLSCVDPSSGRIYWEQELNVLGLSSPVAGKRYIAVVSTTNKLYLIDSDTGDILFERYVRKGSFGDPVISDDILYVLSNTGRLFSFKISELKPRKSIRRRKIRQKS